MVDKHFRSTARSYKCCAMYRYIQVCNKTRQRRYAWLGCIVVVIVLLFLPFKNDTRRRPVLVTSARDKTTDSESINILREIEARLETNITNSTILKIEHYFAAKNLLNDSEREDNCISPLCEQGRLQESKLAFPTATIILSLYNILSEVEALLYIRQNLQHISSHLTDDVIITAEENLPRSLKDLIEEIVDLCSFCRLFFFTGNIYKHRNEAAKFAHNKYLFFVDARIQLTNHWLQPLLHCLQDHEKLVVSPQLLLSYADDNGHNEGLSRNEITWDLGVSRAAVNDFMFGFAQSAGHRYIHQTIISTEVFGIHKQFFTDLTGFDIIPGVTGGEHVSFSLKVLNCNGDIGASFCSKVFFIIPNVAEKSGSRTSVERATDAEFRSPTFSAADNEIKAYYIAASKTWLDDFTTRYFSCSKRSQINVSVLQEVTQLNKKKRHSSFAKPPAYIRDVHQYLNSRYSSYGVSLKQHLIKAKCQVSNLRYIISQRQPDMLVPTKFATYYGYIRTTDDMYAFGIGSNSSSFFEPELSKLHAQNPRESSLGNFILTRNTSLWVGPFSFTNGAFIYKSVWCMTVDRSLQLSLTKCVRGNPNQLFTYTNNIITPLGVVTRCVCARRSPDISRGILMMSCSEISCLKYFKLDVTFTDKCLT